MTQQGLARDQATAMPMPHGKCVRPTLQLPRPQLPPQAQRGTMHPQVTPRSGGLARRIFGLPVFLAKAGALLASAVPLDAKLNPFRPVPSASALHPTGNKSLA